MANLRQLRERSELYLKDVAQALEVSFSMVGRWERGERDLSLTPAQTRMLLNMYGVTLEELEKAVNETKS